MKLPIILLSVLGLVGGVASTTWTGANLQQELSKSKLEDSSKGEERKLQEDDTVLPKAKQNKTKQSNAKLDFPARDFTGPNDSVESVDADEPVSDENLHDLMAEDLKRYEEWLQLIQAIVVEGKEQSSEALLVEEPALNCDLAKKNCVHCVGGMDAFYNGTLKEPPTTCDEACDGKCCTSEDNNETLACGGLTAVVTRDGSCEDSDSCTNAVVGLITGGSCEGNRACYAAGHDGGRIGTIKNSCRGFQACQLAASKGGHIDEIDSACIGLNACYEVAYDGKVGQIKNACLNETACSNTGREGLVKNIVDSCWGKEACYFAGTMKGQVDEINAACQGEQSCYILGKEGGQVGEIKAACQGKQSCSKAGYDGGYVGQIKNACIGQKGCYQVAYGGLVESIVDSCLGGESGCHQVGALGSVGSIVDSCLGERACYIVGKLGIVGNILRSCYELNACKYVGIKAVEVGSIIDSCSGVNACAYCGYGGNGLFGPDLFSNIGDIVQSCSGHEACMGVAEGTLLDPTNVSTIKNCCNGDKLCKESKSDVDLIAADQSCVLGAFTAVLAKETAIYSDDQICYATTALHMSEASFKMNNDAGTIYGYEKASNELSCQSASAYPLSPATTTDVGSESVCQLLNDAVGLYAPSSIPSVAPSGYPSVSIVPSPIPSVSVFPSVSLEPTITCTQSRQCSIDSISSSSRGSSTIKEKYTVANIDLVEDTEEPPTNDLIENAEDVNLIIGSAVIVQGTTIGASALEQINFGGNCSPNRSPGVWYRVFVPEDAQYVALTISLCGSWDTYIEVYKPVCFDEYVEDFGLCCIDKDDDSGCGSEVKNIDLKGGEIVYVLVRGYDVYSKGAFSLRLSTTLRLGERA